MMMKPQIRGAIGDGRFLPSTLALGSTVLGSEVYEASVRALKGLLAPATYGLDPIGSEA